MADPHAPAALVCDASAYGTLGDELGQSGTEPADSAGAVAAYRHSLAWTTVPSASIRIPCGPERGLVVNGLKIGSVEMETDPSRAVLKDFQLALQRRDAQPKADKGAAFRVRLRARA